MNDPLQYKIFKFEGHEIKAGPKKGQKVPDSWMWVTFPIRGELYQALYYTSDNKIITQNASKILLTARHVSIAKIREVPREFLYYIIKYEFWR